MIIDFKQLAIDSDANARDKGFYDPPRSISGDVILFHEELSEAVGDYRNHRKMNEVYYEDKKPCGIPVELADLIIRIAQHMGYHQLGERWAKNVDFLSQEAKWESKYVTDFELFVRKAHGLIGLATDDTDDDPTIRIRFLAALTDLVMVFCKNNDIDLETAVRDKAAYNRTRHARHGGRKI